jgi:hypothetical protein
MKTKISIVATMLAAVVLFGFGWAQAAQFPLAWLAGNWAGQNSATYSVCFNSGFTAVEDCSTEVVPVV